MRARALAELRGVAAFAVTLACLAVSSGTPLAAEPEPSEGDGTAPSLPAEADATVVKIRTTAPKKSPWGEVLVTLARRIESESKDAAGKARLSVRFDWLVASETKAVKACEAGKVSGLAMAFGAFAPAVPELAATEVPFLFDDYTAADRALKAARPLITTLLAEKGFVLALRSENGFRQWASRTTFLARPQDFRGRAMRSGTTSVSLATYRALGASPLSIDVADVPGKLVEGVVDGYDNTLLFGRLAQWSKEITFVTVSNHSYQAAGLVWCKTWLDGLPGDLQAILTRRDGKTEELETNGISLVRRFNDELMPRQYARAGKQVRALTTDERAAFKLALAGVEKDFVETTSPRGKELLALLKKPR